MVVGTFLPWLQSGRALRNSYTGSGAIRDLIEVHGVLRALFAVWPFVGLVCAVAAALLLLGARRIGAAAALVAAGVAGGVAIWALSAHARGAIHRAGAGPTVTLLGSIMVLVCAVPCAVSSRIELGGPRDNPQ